MLIRLEVEQDVCPHDVQVYTATAFFSGPLETRRQIENMQNFDCNDFVLQS
jgi:hypothetical protein